MDGLDGAVGGLGGGSRGGVDGVRAGGVDQREKTARTAVR